MRQYFWIGPGPRFPQGYLIDLASLPSLLCWLNDRYRQSHSFGDRAFDLVPNKNLGKSGPAINIDLIMQLS